MEGPLKPFPASPMFFGFENDARNTKRLRDSGSASTAYFLVRYQGYYQVGHSSVISLSVTPSSRAVEHLSQYFSLSRTRCGLRPMHETLGWLVSRLHGKICGLDRMTI